MSQDSLSKENSFFMVTYDWRCRVQSVAEFHEPVPWCRVPAVCRGHVKRAANVLRYELISAGPSDFFLVRMWHN